MAVLAVCCRAIPAPCCHSVANERISTDRRIAAAGSVAKERRNPVAVLSLPVVLLKSA